MPTRALALAARSALLALLVPAAAQAEPFEVAGPLSGVRLRELARDLTAITAIAHADTPGAAGRLYIALREGRVVVWDGSGILPDPLLDIRSQVSTGGESGLLGLAFHPGFAGNGLFFVHYTDSAGATRLARYRVVAGIPGDPGRADPASAVDVLTVGRVSPFHNGGQIAFGPDGYLYLALGDGGNAGDAECNAQRRDSLFGKILRLDVDRAEGGRPYAVPPDNPFRSGPFLPEVWAAGLRNPWRFSFDRATGDLWIGDVGEGGREEIDVQPAGQGGANWGWSPMEGSLCFGANNCPAYVPACGAPAFAAPLLEYGHDRGCSVTGGFVYRGRAAPQLTGTYLFGDFCSGRIWGAARQGPDLTVRELPRRARLLTTFGEDQAGEIYLGTADGRLLRLEATSPAQPQQVGLFDPERAQFLLQEPGEPAAGIRFGFGRAQSGWIPLAGDWDGDGRDTVGFYDPARSLFRLRNSLSRGVSDVLFAFGPRNAGWLPVVGDWDGDGRDGIGLYSPTAAVFHLKNGLSSGAADASFQLGPPGGGWLPVAGQFDNISGEEVGLYDPHGAAFHLQTAEGERVEPFGLPDSGWLPLAGDWDGDGRNGVALYDPAESRFHLDDLDGEPAVSLLFGTGDAGWLPLAGGW
jgi:glucose/arabinose dehydrogenase